MESVSQNYLHVQGSLGGSIDGHLEVDATDCVGRRNEENHDGT